MYRINLSDRLYSGLNPWVGNVSEIPPMITDDHGCLIETKRPEIIEVAFERVERKQSVADALAAEMSDSRRGQQ